jgi:hypothetical protein
MNQTVEDILNGPDYFLCERYNVRMKKAECIRRQTTPDRNSYEIDHTFTCCKNCGQGADVKEEAGGQIPDVRKQRRSPPRIDIIRKVEARRAVASDDKPKKPGDVKMEEKKKCIVTGCTADVFARGLCKQHYWTWQKNKDKNLGYEPLPSKTSGKYKGTITGAAPKKELASKKKPAENLKVEVIKGAADINASAITNVMIPVNIDEMEKRNSEEFKLFARMFVVNLEHKVLDALQDQMGSIGPSAGSGE